MELNGRKVLVVGFGKTGQALCRFLLRRGAEVTVSDKKPEAELGPRIESWRAKGVRFETGGHQAATFLLADLIVPSPGVHPLAEVEAARGKGIPVVSEIELAFAFLRGAIVGITGSNGKSTTATLAHKILSESGLRSYLAGNIGTPLISFVEGSRQGHVYVTEISSFQLEYTERFKASIPVFLNISQNHLDWHKSFPSYFAAKKKLFSRQGKGEPAVLNRDDGLVWALRREGPFTPYAFSRLRQVARGAFLKDGWIVVRDGVEQRVCPVREISLPGLHNLENVMAAVLVGHLLGVPPASMRRSIKAFRGLEHRLEEVLTLRGVRFVNDSKATTVDATLKAMASFDRPLILILGGRDKGGDFRLLRPALKNKVKLAILVGEAADKIEDALGGSVPIERVSTYKEIVRRTFAAAARGDIVLLAPACTSWDMFRNFEERGRTFKREIRALARSVRRSKRA